VRLLNPYQSKSQAELEARSTPGSALFRQWMGAEDVLSLIAPPAAVRSEVAAALAAGGALCTDLPMGLRCTATVAAVNALYATQLHAFDQLHIDGSVRGRLHRVPPGAPFAIPADLAGKMLFASGLYDFPSRRMRRGAGVRSLSLSGPSSLSSPPPALNSDRGGGGGGGDGGSSAANAAISPDYYIAPESLWSFYATTAVSGSSAARTAPAEFQSYAAVQSSDMSSFASEMDVPAWSIAYKYGTFSGSGLESTLDEEYMGGIGAGNTQYYWTEAGGRRRMGACDGWRREAESTRARTGYLDRAAYHRTVLDLLLRRLDVRVHAARAVGRHGAASVQHLLGLVRVGPVRRGHHRR
jgi:hypothetical protein